MSQWVLKELQPQSGLDKNVNPNLKRMREIKSRKLFTTAHVTRLQFAAELNARCKRDSLNWKFSDVE